MSFFRTVGGKYAAGEFCEMKVNNTGEVYVVFQDNSPSGKIDNAIQLNAAFVVTDHAQAAKSGFYTLLMTVPDDTTKQFYVDWSMASQREGKLKIIENATSVGTPTSKVMENRNRNSAATTAVTSGVVLNAAGDDPETALLGTGGSEMYRHYFPRDVSPAHPVGGRLILKNDTVYAFKFDAAGVTDNEISLRIDLAEIPA